MVGKVLIALLVVAAAFVVYQLVSGSKATASMPAPSVPGTWPSNYGSGTITQVIRAVEQKANTGAGHF